MIMSDTVDSISTNLLQATSEEQKRPDKQEFMLWQRIGSTVFLDDSDQMLRTSTETHGGEDAFGEPICLQRDMSCFVKSTEPNLLFFLKKKNKKQTWCCRYRLTFLCPLSSTCKFLNVYVNQMRVTQHRPLLYCCSSRIFKVLWLFGSFDVWDKYSSSVVKVGQVLSQKIDCKLEIPPGLQPPQVRSGPTWKIEAARSSWSIRI